MINSITMGKHLQVNVSNSDSNITIDWAYIEKAVNYHEKLVKFLTMAACYACVEGSEEEEKFTESLLKELGLDDD